jgi:hypothetical protein
MNIPQVCSKTTKRRSLKTPDKIRYVDHREPSGNTPLRTGAVSLYIEKFASVNRQAKGKGIRVALGKDRL